MVEHELRSLDGAHHLSVLGETDGVVNVEILARPGRDLRQAVGDLAARHGWALMELSSSEVSLEDIFIKLAGRGLAA